MNRIGTSDLEVFPLCLGGNVFGWTADRETSFDILDAYAHARGNFIDTADAYSSWVPDHAGGESEEIIGAWMQARGNRGQMVVATKVGKKPDLLGLRRDTIRTGCEESLRRLRTDYIDLYYCHADDEDTPLEETLGALGELIAEGKVRYVAASNYSADRLEEALAVADALGVPRFVALQPHYNLLVRDEYEGRVRDLCEREHISCLPYFALGAGFLTGKYRSATIGEVPRAGRVSAYLSQQAWEILAAVDAVAALHDVSNAEVALAWLMHQPTVAAPIASATSLAQLAEVLDSVCLSLSADDLALLDRASAPT
ncbi:MAG: aldo/keto reductase [Candidatus Nanopelagicales bacterium]